MFVFSFGFQRIVLAGNVPGEKSISSKLQFLFPHSYAVKICGGKADSTLRSSQAVPHPSTDRALRCLTSEVKRDPVHSARYGRRR